MSKILLILVFIISGCASTDKLSTYKDFGEREGIVKVVDDLFVNLIKDKRTKAFFDRPTQKKTKKNLVDYICAELNGPCEYKGQTMKRAHKGEDVQERGFYAMVESLQDAMNKNNIPKRAQDKLLAILASTHKDVIGH